MVIVQGWMRFGAGEIEGLRDAATRVIAATRQEPGCIGYSFAVDTEEPDLLRISECWADEAALAAHGKAPHAAAFGAALRGGKIVGMEVKAYTASGERTLMSR